MIGTLKDMLPRKMISWNTLLRLMYALCGWLAIFSVYNQCNHRQNVSPLDILGKWLDWLGTSSEFCMTWARWSTEHATLLNGLALGIVVVSICKSFLLKDEKKMVEGIEIPAFLLAVAIALQIGLGLDWFLSSIVFAWIASIVSASLEGVELSNIPIKSMLRRILQSIKPSDMPEQCLVWPLTVLLALAFPILVLAQLLFDGMEDSQSDGK